MTIPTRRTARSGVLLTALLTAGIALSGCSSPAQPSAADTTGSSAASAETSSAPTAFPVTVGSLYGGLTISEPPTRIVALTYQIADILASLIEKVLSYQPDLVVGDSWQIPDQSAYDTLSVVAPTYAGAEKGNVDWDQQTIALAKIIGQPDKATAVIDEVDEMFEASRSSLPELAGKTYHYARFATSEGFAYGNGSWLEQFGLVAAPTQDNSMQNPGVSLENLDQMNADVLAIWAYDDEQPLLEADLRFAALPSTQAGRTIWADLKLAYATNGPGR